jgi:hypothetical protein
LNSNLIASEWLKEDESNQSVEANNFEPNWHESGLSKVSEVVLSDKDQVCGSVATSCEQGGFPKAFSVVKAVDNREIFLPLVCVHLVFNKYYKKIIITITHSVNLIQQMFCLAVSFLNSSNKIIVCNICINNL